MWGGVEAGAAAVDGIVGCSMCLPPGLDTRGSWEAVGEGGCCCVCSFVTADDDQTSNILIYIV